MNCTRYSKTIEFLHNVSVTIQYFCTKIRSNINIDAWNIPIYSTFKSNNFHTYISHIIVK